MTLEYLHVDVFTPRAFSGNSLAVILNAGDLDPRQMLAITRELRHFESIFVQREKTKRAYSARVFDLLDELPFAGHPLIGAAAALHHRDGTTAEVEWSFELPSRTVSVASRRTHEGYSALLDQGEPLFLGEHTNREEVASAFGLAAADLDPRLPLATISTGLRYLVVPVERGALAKAAIKLDITDLVARAGAQYAVLLDDAALEMRHWTNDGKIEDVATGSAAGTIGAYRLRYAEARPDETFRLHQGRFTGRPSQLYVEPSGGSGPTRSVRVGGNVAIVGHGVLDVRPDRDPEGLTASADA